MRRILLSFLPLLLGACATTPNQPAIPDEETRAWWALTTALSDDSMEGRDTGSPGYDRAARLVAKRFEAAGLRPAGEGGSWFQPIRMREVLVVEGGTDFALVGGDGRARALRFLHDLTIGASTALPPALDAPMAFRGYCDAAALKDVKGRVAVCFNARRKGVTSAAERVAAATAAGAAALIQIDDPSFTVEPPRWPAAYARAVAPVSAPLPSAAMPVIRYNPDALPALLAGSGQDAEAILAAGGRGDPLPSFDLPLRLRARITLRTADLQSANVVALLPGTDPRLRDEHIVLGAHLDGYGYGTPIDGDGLYNGTFDDAAYVATLIRLAEQRRGRGFRRSILFVAFTGEEKGLIGARWLAANPPVPKEKLAAMINLDQLRPIFPLDILTVHALEDTTLGEDARAVAGEMGIRTRIDPEPERNLISRADHWPFLQADVPAVNFVFGYEPGTDAERRYRLWYRTRYHHPGDDPSQPWDPAAAARFNSFFYRLVDRVADADRRPAFLKANPYRPKQPAKHLPVGRTALQRAKGQRSGGDASSMPKRSPIRYRKLSAAHVKAPGRPCGTSAAANGAGDGRAARIIIISALSSALSDRLQQHSAWSGRPRQHSVSWSRLSSATATMAGLPISAASATMLILLSIPASRAAAQRRKSRTRTCSPQACSGSIRSISIPASLV